MNILYIILIIGIIIGSYEPSEDQITFADINQDNIIDVLDIVLIISIIFN